MGPEFWGIKSWPAWSSDGLLRSDPAPFSGIIQREEEYLRPWDLILFIRERKGKYVLCMSMLSDEV